MLVLMSEYLTLYFTLKTLNCQLMNRNTTIIMQNNFGLLRVFYKFLKYPG